jgi:hypothetical protein
LLLAMQTKIKRESRVHSKPDWRKPHILSTRIP